MSYDDRSVVHFLQATHGIDLLSDREKHLVGLAVTMTRGCQVCTRNRIVNAWSDKGLRGAAFPRLKSRGPIEASPVTERSTTGRQKPYLAWKPSS